MFLAVGVSGDLRGVVCLLRAGVRIPQHVHATADPKEALMDATYIIHAVPVQYTRRFLEKVSVTAWRRWRYACVCQVGEGEGGKGETGSS